MSGDAACGVMTGCPMQPPHRREWAAAAFSTPQPDERRAAYAPPGFHPPGWLTWALSNPLVPAGRGAFRPILADRDDSYLYVI